MVPKRIANIIIGALKGGVVPRVGLEYITVGRKQEIDAFLHDIDIIADGGASFRFVVGRYGSGKSFLLQTIRNYAMNKNFVVLDGDLSPERRFSGSKGQGLATYKELIRNMSVKSKPDGGALPLILEKWISNLHSEVAQSVALDDPRFQNLVSAKIFEVTSQLEGMVNGFEFAKAVNKYYQGYCLADNEIKSNVLRWFRGEYQTRTEAKRDLEINFIISDDNWYDFIKIMASFMVKAGYKGCLVMVDELVNIFKIPHSVTRNNNYEKILTMYNDVMQGKASHLGFVLGCTPQAIEDRYKGVFSYEALRSRLAEGHFSSDDIKDLSAPIIRLKMLTQEEMFVLIEKLKDIHADLYGYKSNLTQDDLIYFLNVEFNRVGADSHITPREIIRDFIELINIIYQNPQLNIKAILSSNSFELTKGEEEDVTDFVGFEL